MGSEDGVVERQQRTSITDQADRSFLLPPDVGELAPLRDQLSVALADRLKPDRLSLILVAVTEAVTNAIEAHHRLDSDELVVVGLDLDEGVLTVDDVGGGFDLSEAQSTRSHLDERGRGYMIMKGICPELEIESTERGTRIVLPLT